MKIGGKVFLRRIAVWAAVAICFSVFIGTQEGKAASAMQMCWHDGSEETDISVEAGSKFYIGDFVSIYTTSTSATASLLKASYRTQSKSVASVNGKGYLTAKKPGTSDITVTYQGKALVCHLTVEKKGTIEQGRAVKALKAEAKKLAKGLPKKLSAAKGYALRRKRDAYLGAYGANSSSKLSYDGFLYENERPAPDNVSEKKSVILAAPEAGRYLTAEALLRQYLLDNDPTSTESKKTMRIASANANSKNGKITVSLTKKLGADQILGAQLAFPKKNSVTGSKLKANIQISIYDETDAKYYKGEIVLKKGARQLIVRPVVYGYGGYHDVSLVKGHVYLLGSGFNWAGGRKITAK